MWSALFATGTGRAGNFLGKNGAWIFLLLVCIAIWYWFRPYFKRLFGLLPDDAPFEQGGGDVTVAFYQKRSNAARRLRETLTSNALTSDGRCEAIYDANSLNANELRLIHNTYKNKFGDTLYSDLGSVYTDDCSFLGMSSGLNEQLAGKLNAIGLT
jgi:hypothetical protein